MYPAGGSLTPPGGGDGKGLAAGDGEGATTGDGLGRAGGRGPIMSLSSGTALPHSLKGPLLAADRLRTKPKLDATTSATISFF